MGLCESKNIKIYTKMNKKIENDMKKHGFYVVQEKIDYRNYIYPNTITDITFNNNDNTIKIFYKYKSYVIYNYTEIKYQRILYYRYDKIWIDIEIIDKKKDILHNINT
jgi:hypothetical protein